MGEQRGQFGSSQKGRKGQNRDENDKGLDEKENVEEMCKEEKR